MYRYFKVTRRSFFLFFHKRFTIFCSVFEGCFVEILTAFSVFSKTSRASSKLHFSSIHSLSRFPWTNSSNLPELYLFGRFRILVAFSRSRKTEIWKSYYLALWKWTYYENYIQLLRKVFFFNLCNPKTNLSLENGAKNLWCSHGTV